jgi:hypothetical protein
VNQLAAHAAAVLLMVLVLPVWIAAGLADYFCHRATNIERTSATPESLLHLVQFTLIGVPIVFALFLEANAGFFLMALICLVLHHVVAAIDLVYANPKRHIAPREQMVHSFLEILPITSLLLLSVINWPQALALFGLGPEQARFLPHARPLPLTYVSAVLGAAFLFNFLPYIEELYRCIRASRR